MAALARAPLEMLMALGSKPGQWTGRQKKVNAGGSFTSLCLHPVRSSATIFTIHNKATISHSLFTTPLPSSLYTRTHPSLTITCKQDLEGKEASPAVDLMAA